MIKSHIFLFYKAINIISFIVLFILALYNIKSFFKINEYYINYETNENRYIEYYAYSSTDKTSYTENINTKKFYYKKYELFCYCRNKNYRVYDSSICLSSKQCDSYPQLLKDNYELYPLSYMNERKLSFNKYKYNFFQGINNITGKCDINLNYRSCAYLNDLKTYFCVKEYKQCPILFFDANNLYNMIDDVILYYDDEQKIKLYNNYNISDFLPDLNIKKNIININSFIIIDSTNLFKFTFDNNIPFLKETINEDMKKIKINLVMIETNYSNIKYNDSNYQEKIFYKELSYKLFYKIIYILFYVIYIIYFIFFSYYSIFYFIKKKEEKLYSIYEFLRSYFIFLIFIIGITLYIYNNNKIEIDKDYNFNDEYYFNIKSIKKSIRYLFILFILPLPEFVYISYKLLKNKYNFDISKYLCCKRRNTNITQIVNIQ